MPHLACERGHFEVGGRRRHGAACVLDDGEGVLEGLGLLGCWNCDVQWRAPELEELFCGDKRCAACGCAAVLCPCCQEAVAPGAVAERVVDGDAENEAAADEVELERSHGDAVLVVVSKGREELFCCYGLWKQFWTGEQVCRKLRARSVEFSVSKRVAHAFVLELCIAGEFVFCHMLDVEPHGRISLLGNPHPSAISVHFDTAC